MCQSLSAFSLGCWCYLCDSTSSFLLHLFFFVDVVLFFFYSSLVKTMDALSLFSFAVFSRLSGRAFLPSSCFRQAFFFNALSITHHPHFVPEQLFPFFVPLWWKHDSVLHLTWTDVNKYTPSSFFFCSCIPFVIYPLLSTPNSLLPFFFATAVHPFSSWFGKPRKSLPLLLKHLCGFLFDAHRGAKGRESGWERGRVRGSTENLRKVAGCVCPCVIHHLWWRALSYSSFFSTNKMIDMKNTLKCEKEKRG